MTFIIAEVGSNYGSLEDCILSVRIAKRCGADAVKFQLFTHKELYGFDGKMGHELPREWVFAIKRECEKSDIEFMCTGFSPDGFKFLDPFVKRHKIASSCNSTPQILETVASFKKPAYMSTGAASLEEINRAMQYLDGVGIPLYCVASYPAKVIDLNIITTLKSYFMQAGYSDHSIDVLNIPRLAVERGASVIEKHFNAVGFQGPDTPHSINPYEFDLMVKSIRGVRSMSRIGWTPEEQSMAYQYRNRCIAIKDIQPGDKLVLNENYGVYRATKEDQRGVTGFMCYEVNNAIAAKPIKSGIGISLLDL